MVRKITRKILSETELKPIKHRGQNFLVSAEYIKKIVASAEVKNGDTVLEIGPGTGNLTMALLEKGAEVVTVENDSKLVHLLISNFQFPISKQKLKVIEEDILVFDETKIKPPYKIVANIPYYITGKIIQKFLFSSNQPAEMILMVQREVGERICAEPPKANYLSSLAQSFAKVKILFGVKRENFWPKPKVDSVAIRITPIHNVQHSVLNIMGFVEFLKMVFRQPRQTLFNNLRKNGFEATKIEIALKKLGFDKNTRPQNLDIKTLRALYEKIMTND